MKTIVLANQKGGVGKTTTAFALACELGKKCKVLAIDGDPQCNLTFLCNKGEDYKTLEDVMSKKESISRVIINTGLFDVVCSSRLLADADRRFTGAFDYMILKKALKEVEKQYDYCVIDSPPNLGILSVNYLTASDYIVIPVNPCAFSLQGLSYIKDIVESIKENANPNIQIAGVLLTRVVKRAKVYEVSQSVIKELESTLNTKLFDTYIRQSVAVSSSQMEKKDLLNYARNKGVAEDYIKWTNELLEVING